MIVTGEGSRVLRFVLEGLAQTKGSAKGFVPWPWVEAAWQAFKRSGKKVPPRVVITNDNPDAKAWQEQIAAAAVEARRSGPLARGELMAGALVVEIRFHLERPQKIRSSVVSHTTRPDLDKLTRCVLDGLTGVVYGDDGQVAAMLLAKQYAAIGEVPRVEVSITEATVADPAAPPLFT